jgi:hypothetical protein
MKPKKSTSKKILPEAGVHVARLIQVLDWGSQIDKFSGDEGRAKVELVWELPQSLHVFNEDKGEQPLIVSRKYGNTLGRGSAIKKDIESMLGHAIDKDFEFDTLLGEMCQMNLSIESDGEYENVVIQSLMPLMKDQAKKKYPEYNDKYILDLDNFDLEVWEALPEWKRTEIAKSPEAAQALASAKPKAAQKVATKTNGKATPPPAAKASPFKKAAEPAAKAGAVKGKK